MATHELQHRFTLINKLNNVGVRIAGGTVRKQGKVIGHYKIYPDGLALMLEHPWDVSNELIAAKVERILKFKFKNDVK